MGPSRSPMPSSVFLELADACGRVGQLGASDTAADHACRAIGGDQGERSGETGDAAIEASLCAGEAAVAVDGLGGVAAGVQLRNLLAVGGREQLQVTELCGGQDVAAVDKSDGVTRADHDVLSLDELVATAELLALANFFEVDFADVRAGVGHECVLLKSHLSLLGELFRPPVALPLSDRVCTLVF